MTKSCQVGLNVSKLRTKLQSDFNLPKSVAKRLNTSTVQSTYRRCKDANSFPPMKMVKSGPYIYYIDSRSILTAGNYEKLMQRGTYTEDLRRVANKLGIYDGETKKERIRSNIFEFLQSSGIAEPIRLRNNSVKTAASSSSVVADTAKNNNFSVPTSTVADTAKNNNFSVPSTNTKNNNFSVPSTNTKNNNFSVPSTNTKNNNFSVPSTNTKNNSLGSSYPTIKPSVSSYPSLGSQPTYKPTMFVENQPYDGYTRTTPSQLRLRVPRNNYRRGGSGGFFNMFGRGKNENYFKGFYNNNKKKNTKEEDLKKKIQKKYQEEGVTPEYLFEYFKGRPHRDQINLNRFMNNYIPANMRKNRTTWANRFKKIISPKKGNSPAPPPNKPNVPAPAPVPKQNGPAQNIKSEVKINTPAQNIKSEVNQPNIPAGPKVNNKQKQITDLMNKIGKRLWV